MVAIAKAESGCDPNAVSPAHLNYDGISDYGLLQIHGTPVLDPAENIKLAYSIYQRQGLNAWNSYKSGAHLKFESL